MHFKTYNQRVFKIILIVLVVCTQLIHYSNKRRLHVLRSSPFSCLYLYLKKIFMKNNALFNNLALGVFNSMLCFNNKLRTCDPFWGFWLWRHRFLKMNTIQITIKTVFNSFSCNLFMISSINVITGIKQLKLLKNEPSAKFT